MYDKVNQDDCGCSSCDCDDKQINNFVKNQSIRWCWSPIDAIRGKNVEPREENDPNPNQK